MITKYKFLFNNILFPHGKITIKLGSSDLAKTIINHFNKRKWNRGFIKLKKYNIALLPIDSFQFPENYMASVNGKNSAAYFSRRCTKFGYRCQFFNPNDEIESIFEINNSKESRQGKVMEESYKTKITFWPDDNENRWFGVYSIDGKLVAYVWIKLIGEMILINRILGHNDHLNNNVMYLILTELISDSIKNKDYKCFMYDTFGKVENGLVLYKKRLGFRPYTVNFIQ